MANSYIINKQVYDHLKRKVFPCSPTLGLSSFARLTGASQGVSGDVLARATIDDIPVVIKFFRTPCPYNKITYQGREIIRARAIDDKNRFEIGNAILLTEEIMMNEHDLTPNITFSFNYGLCPFAYQGEKSHCNPKQSIEGQQYLVPLQCDNQYQKLPQCSFRSDYDNGQSSDMVRYLISERANGDLESLITDTFIPEGDFDHVLGGIIVMIAYTLHLLDSYFDGFVHGDLGPRNILYTVEKPSVWRYLVNFNDQSEESYDIDIIYSPKLWDFSTSYINGSSYSYLNNETSPRSVFKEDLTILFAKILELIGQTSSELIPLMEKYLPLSQQMSNREICQLFLKEDWIRREYSQRGHPEMVFSFDES